MRDFGESITYTYSRLKYETCLSKLFSCYYCKCKCFCRTAINNFVPPLSRQNKYLNPKPDLKPDLKPDPKPDLKPEPKPKPDPKPDLKPDPKLLQNVKEIINDVEKGK